MGSIACVKPSKTIVKTWKSLSTEHFGAGSMHDSTEKRLLTL